MLSWAQDFHIPEVDPIVCITLVTSVQIEQLLNVGSPEMDRSRHFLPLALSYVKSYSCCTFLTRPDQIIFLVLRDTLRNVEEKHKVGILIAGVNCFLLLAPSISEHVDVLFEGGFWNKMFTLGLFSRHVYWKKQTNKLIFIFHLHQFKTIFVLVNGSLLNAFTEMISIEHQQWHQPDGFSLWCHRGAGLSVPDASFIKWPDGSKFITRTHIMRSSVLIRLQCCAGTTFEC